jgi:hypothetical protein
VCLSDSQLVDQGKSVILQAVDRCDGCKANDLDMAPKAFLKLFDTKDKGRISAGTSWEWVE